MDLSTILPTVTVETANKKAEKYRQQELEQRVPKVLEDVLNAIDRAAINKLTECGLNLDGYNNLHAYNRQVIQQELERRGFRLAGNKTTIVWNDSAAR